MNVFAGLADGVVAAVPAIDPASKTASALHFFVEDVTKIFVLLAAVIFVIGLLRSALTPERARRLIGGRSRVAAYPAAVGLGAVTPFCSCSSVPLFIGFLEAGIPLGVTMAFLIASPMINEIAVVLLVALVGWKVAALYVATGLAVGILGGVAVEKLRLERYVEDYVWKIRMGEAAVCGSARGVAGRTAYAWGQMTDILRRIWPYVLAGVGIGALLHGYVPQEFFLRYASADNPFAVPAAVMAGIPLYSNVSGAIPVAEALIGKGVPVGTVLALIMSIAAISLPEMVILRQVLKVRMLVFFAGILAVSFVAVGYLFNLILA